MKKDKWFEEYKMKVFDSKISYKSIGRFINRHFPMTLYRYRRFGNHWRDEIFSGYVHLSKSSELNDPFDCLVYVEQQEFRNKVLKKLNIPGYNVLNIKNDESWNRWITELQNIVRVACFTETNTNPLMWAHYSEGHQGFCIEYDFKKIFTSWKNFVFPVIYLSEKYDATDDAIEFRNNNLANPFLIKSDIWQYENEWRLLWTEEHVQDESYFNIDFSGAISAIYFGVNAEKNSIYMDAKKEIEAWAKNNDVKLFQMKIHEKKYELVSERII